MGSAESGGGFPPEMYGVRPSGDDAAATGGEKHERVEEERGVTAERARKMLKGQ